MIISIASGKGGTGKTTIAVSLALAIEGQRQLLDCDVEEPNAHIFIKPEITIRQDVLVKNPQVVLSKCNLCKRCSEICQYNAISVVQGQVIFYPELCHSCGACSYMCPQQAIGEIERKIGILERGKRDNVEFIRGILNIGEVLATPVIKAIKQYIDSKSTVVIDCPPGTSCPVIAAVTGSDYCILVTEPTPFGLNDLILAVEVLRKLDISFGVIINRADLGNNAVETYCIENQIEILMRIPFSEKIAAAYSKGIPIVKIYPEYKQQLQSLFKKIEVDCARNSGY